MLEEIALQIQELETINRALKFAIDMYNTSANAEYELKLFIADNNKAIAELKELDY